MLFQAAQKLFGMAARLDTAKRSGQLCSEAIRCPNSPFKPVRLNRTCDSIQENLICSSQHTRVTSPFELPSMVPVQTASSVGFCRVGACACKRVRH